jgi:hypothetical protein
MPIKKAEECMTHILAKTKLLCRPCMEHTVNQYCKISGTLYLKKKHNQK